MAHKIRSLMLTMAVCCAFSPRVFLPVLGGEKSGKLKVKAGKKQFFKGSVLPLKEIIERVGSKLDAKAAPYWFALVTGEGTVYPLIADGGSRMFYTDKRTRNRPVRLTGRLIGGSHLLQVFDVHSYRKGKLCELFYWCDVCSIRRSSGGVCECCGGSMNLRERLAER